MKHHIAESLINLRDQVSMRSRRPILVAHRGGVIGANAPENSLAVIQLAAIHGYDMVELDVREAKDGEPVLFHGLVGSSLLIDCGIDETIENLTSPELSRIPYRGSTETIATLAKALALCAACHLGVMLDIKSAVPSEEFLQRISDLLELSRLGDATVTIERHPLVRQHLAHNVIQRVTQPDFERIAAGEMINVRDQFWFGWAAEIKDPDIEALQRNGAFVIPSINSFHYPVHAHKLLARQDIRRLTAAGVEGFQIDSEYQYLFDA
jgi:glycerophosphoryl diester phosphodiesterase